MPAKAAALPNVGERPARRYVDLIVLHSISLPPGQYGGPGAAAVHQRPGLAGPSVLPADRGAGGVVALLHRRGGELWQFASCDARAWHAGTSHYRGRDNCNDDSVGIELEGLEGDQFEDARGMKPNGRYVPRLRNATLGIAHVAKGRAGRTRAQAGPGTRFSRWQSLRLPATQRWTAWPRTQAFSPNRCTCGLATEFAEWRHQRACAGSIFAPQR